MNVAVTFGQQNSVECIMEGLERDSIASISVTTWKWRDGQYIGRTPAVLIKSDIKRRQFDTNAPILTQRREKQRGKTAAREIASRRV